MNEIIKQIRSDNILEKQEEDMKKLIMDMASEMTLKEVRDYLNNSWELDVSLATVGRYVKRHREAELIEDGEEMQESVEKLAGRGRGEKLKRATMEMLRQKLFEQAAHGENVQETMALYEKLLREEKELKQLALAERRAAQADESLRLQRERLRLDEVKAVLELLPKAVKILSDESMDANARVAEARRCLVGWKEARGAIEVGAS